MNTTVAKNAYSSNDQIRGKAERKAKKALYEYITGSDFGDGDESSTVVVDAVAVEIRDEANKGEAIGIDQATEEKTLLQRINRSHNHSHSHSRRRQPKEATTLNRLSDYGTYRYRFKQ